MEIDFYLSDRSGASGGMKKRTPSEVHECLSDECSRESEHSARCVQVCDGTETLRDYRISLVTRLPIRTRPSTPAADTMAVGPLLLLVRYRTLPRLCVCGGCLQWKCKVSYLNYTHHTLLHIWPGPVHQVYVPGPVYVRSSAYTYTSTKGRRRRRRRRQRP